MNKLRFLVEYLFDFLLVRFTSKSNTIRRCINNNWWSRMRLWMCATEWSATDSTTFTVCAVTDCCCCDDDDDRVPTTTTTTMWRRRKGNHKNATNTHNHTCARCDSSTWLLIQLTSVTLPQRRYTLHRRRTTQRTHEDDALSPLNEPSHYWFEIFFRFSHFSFPCVFLSVRMSKWHFSIRLPPFVTHTPHWSNVAYRLH